jgi:hypothetical protein
VSVGQPQLAPSLAAATEHAVLTGCPDYPSAIYAADRG